ncbi:MAG: hypothetical protein QY332_10520 [Anaerolineales bacterium]|nr:MAG: hypothetical protein QY332_10520 [Anaerolineales bacterium]
MMRKSGLVLLLVVLVLVVFGLGYWLVVGGNRNNFPGSGLVRKFSVPFFGEIVLPLNEQFATNKTSFDDAQKPSVRFDLPVTEFLPESMQKVDAMVVSRGYGEDEIERALLRGIVTTMETRYLEMEVAGKNFKVYFPRVFEQMCIPSTITDTKGVKVETKKGFIDLTTYRTGVEERGMEEVGEILSVGDDTLILARHKEGDFVAITVAGYGCVR